MKPADQLTQPQEPQTVDIEWTLKYGESETPEIAEYLGHQKEPQK